MIRKSGHRFSEKIMRKTRIWSAIPSRSRNFIARFALPQKIFGGTSAARLSQQVDRGVATVWYDGKEGFETLEARRRTSMADKGSDPIALWQKMVGEMEKGFNAFANQTMSSPEFSKAMNQAGNVSAGAQKQFGDLMEKYLLNMNLPSRAQMIGMAERLQNIEGQLNEIKAMLQQMNAVSGMTHDSTAAAPRPPRTRRPPAAAPAAPPAPSGEQK
jgi:hypothetical protein